MTFEITKILQSKRECRQRAAARPIKEKLAMLDALRARALALRPMKSKINASDENPSQHLVSENEQNEN